MESGRLFFDPSACHSDMLFLRNGGAAFQGARSTVSIEETSKRRPFFISPDDYLFDEAYYDEQLPDKKRRLTPDQAHMLEKSFEIENKLEPERKTQLATKLGLQPRQVAVWFQNRRARWKTKQIERDYDVLKSSYDALLSNYDTLVRENEKLKSEVVSLTEKVEVKMDSVSGGNGVILFSNKLEDGLSSGSGSGRSAVVDDRDGPQQLVGIDSGDEYGGCMGGVEGGGVQSEEDDGRSYFSDVLAAAADDQIQEPWWVWS